MHMINDKGEAVYFNMLTFGCTPQEARPCLCLRRA